MTQAATPQMPQIPQILKPLKTWSHLATRRRKPSEYEIVSTNLHFSTDNPDARLSWIPTSRWRSGSSSTATLRP